jgi:SAM-dependent methyltransferase
MIEPTSAEPPFLSGTRSSYDTWAADYAERFQAELAAKPMDRALLAAFAELVRGAGGGLPVADLGCGPGHVTAHLNGLGLTAFGVDLAPEMITVARLSHPELRFEVGSMTALDLPDGSLGGIVAFYSIIHLPDAELPRVFAEFHRVLAPGGQLLLAFHDGAELLRLDESDGHPVPLDYYLRSPELVAGPLGRAGLPVTARLTREPYEAESLRRVYLVAGRPVDGSGPEGRVQADG